MPREDVVEERGPAMDGERFDALAKALTGTSSRRHAARLLLAAAGWAGLGSKRRTAVAQVQACTTAADCGTGQCWHCVDGRCHYQRCKACHYCDAADGTCKRSCEDPGCCDKGKTCCPGVVCANLQSDEGHCGDCFTTCSPGQLCCDGHCVDPKTDNTNCGGCAGADGVNCTAKGKTCCSGTCIPSAATCCLDESGTAKYCPQPGIDPRRTECCADRDGLVRDCCRPDVPCCNGECCPSPNVCCPDGKCYHPTQSGIAPLCCPEGGACRTDQVCCTHGTVDGSGGARCCWAATHDCVAGKCVAKCPKSRRCNGQCCASGSVCVGGFCCPGTSACGSQCCPTGGCWGCVGGTCKFLCTANQYCGLNGCVDCPPTGCGG